MRVLLALALTPLISAGAWAQSEFKPPVQISAGENDFSGILYPSPVLQDLNGDGQHELVIGDLRGFIQAASRLSPGEPSSWGELTNVKATDEKDLKFSNW